MSKVYGISENWKKFKSIRRLVIFGDSYSSVEDYYEDKRPDALGPLGVDFPGSTWNEPNKPNWVGHLITKYCPQPRYMPDNADDDVYPVENEEERAAWIDDPFLVHDYARGGDRVHNVAHQIRSLFIPGMGKKPDWAQWTPTETLFVTWVGINDCAYLFVEEIENTLKVLVNAQEDLYNAGAKNFLFIDVPPIHRSPAVSYSREETVMEKIKTWNECLRREVQAFALSHSEATVLLFSSYEALNDLLDNAEQYGFKVDDLKEYGGSVWNDHIHPTSKVHDNIAHRIASFLDNVQCSSISASDQ